MPFFRLISLSQDLASVLQHTRHEHGMAWRANNKVSNSAVSQWQQCGGSNYNGCTSCASGFSCKEINAYYHQCA